MGRPGVAEILKEKETWVNHNAFGDKLIAKNGVCAGNPAPAQTPYTHTSAH